MWRASWFDADSIIMNQLLPLEVFIPPGDFKHINWLAAKDFNGLNAGVFIIRVCPWTLDLLTRTMTYKHYHPDEDYTFEEQSILARLTEKDSDFKDQSTFVPKNWFNAYFYFLNEVKPGLLLSHFPHPDYKWHIYEWLRVLDADKDEAYKPVYNRPVQDTDYPEEIHNFWNVKRRAEKALKGFQRNVNRGADPIKFGLEHDETKDLAVEFRDKLQALKEAATYKVDDPKQLEKMVVETEEVSFFRGDGGIWGEANGLIGQRQTDIEADDLLRDARQSAAGCWVLIYFIYSRNSFDTFLSFFGHLVGIPKMLAFTGCCGIFIAFKTE